MSKELKMNLWHALFVGLGSGILIAIYATLVVTGIVENPIYWACFIMLPTVLMFGAQWKDVPFHWINVLAGLFMGWICFQLTAMMAGGLGLNIALGVATCVVTIILQAVTAGFLGKSIGRCPMAFVGLICCFACGGENLLVAAISLLIGVVTSTFFGQTGAWAAKLAGMDQE